MNTTTIATEDVTCTCSVHPNCETIRVPATMLVNPSRPRTTAKYRAGAIHSLIDMNRLVRCYEIVG